uniref:Uncharacterized protein n=1 Tax=Arundo donax TaxID=35708 RepID=A0A0A9HRE6_ARUDO
MTEPSNQP